MKAFYTLSVLVLAAQSAAFSAAKAPTPNYSRRARQPLFPAVASAPLRPQGSLALSPAAAAGFLVRGGASAAGDVVLQNFHKDALGFFGAIRIPASFLAGTSLAALFSLKGVARDLAAKDSSRSTTERRVIKLYHLVSFLAFLLSLTTVLTATSAHTSVLHGRFDPMAETAYMLMKREFEYEFVSARCSFLWSIFCFVGMVASRVMIEFGLLTGGEGRSGKGRKDVTLLVLCAMGAFATNLLSYVNSTLWCWNSLPEMTVYLAKLVVKRAFNDFHPLQIVSVFFTIASTYLVGKMVVNDLSEGSSSKTKDD